MKKLGVFAFLVLLAACSKDIQTTEAVRQAIVDDIQQRKGATGVDPGLVETTVSAVSFGKDSARADVSFGVKSAPGAGGMNMTYVLQRQGSKWVVTGRQMSGANPHGAQGMPESPTTPGTPQ